MSDSSPGAGSRTSVRSWWRLRRTRRYWASSAWQRRQVSTWRRRARSAVAAPSTIPGRALLTSSHRMGALLSQLREQPLPETAAGPVQVHLGRRLADAELVGDGRMGQVVDVAQDDHRPEAIGELLEGLVQPRSEEFGVGRRLWVVFGPDIGERGLLVELLVAGARPLGHCRGRAVGRDAVHPGREARLAPKALQPLVGPQVGLLHHV